MSLLKTAWLRLTRAWALPLFFVAAFMCGLSCASTVHAAVIPGGGTAVGDYSLTLNTGGDAAWFVTGSTIQSGLTSTMDNMSSWVETTINGPAMASFSWKVSSELGYDYLTFSIDGVVQPGSISGEEDWQVRTYFVPANSHTLRWTYSKDESESMHSDAGWLDNVIICSGSYRLDPSLATSPFSGGSDSIAVIITMENAQTGPCGWNAVSNDSWITIPPDSGSGIGNGTVAYSAAAGVDLAGTMTIAGQTILVKRTGTGSLDGAFSAPNGFTTYRGMQGDDAGKATAVQADGKIVVAGSIFRGTDSDVLVTRYNTDGTLDESFNMTGTMIHAGAANTNDEARAIVVQPDGKIIVAGHTGYTETGGVSNGTAGGFVMRLNADGTFDTAFGTSGVVLYGTALGDDAVNALALQTDGKIVIAGYRGNGIDRDVLVLRLNKDDGSLDTSFNSSGVKTWHGVAGGANAGNGVAIQTDGKIVVAGYSSNGSDPDALVLRLRSEDGSLDAAFNTSGIVTYDKGYNDYANAAAIQPDGAIVVAGKTENITNDYDALVLRYTAAGVLDSTFNASGVQTYHGPSGGDDQVNALAIDPDGNIMIVGNTYMGSSSMAAMVMRYTGSGTPDAAFGTSGMIIFNNVAYDKVVNDSDDLFAIALQNNGRIVAVGESWNGSDYDVLLMRLLGDAVPPSIISTSPAADAVDVPINSAITLTFNEEMKASTINASSVVVNDVAGALIYEPSTRTATFTPSSDLNYGTNYTITVSGAQDRAGNVLSPDFTWSFTTEIYTTVTVTALAEANGGISPSGAQALGHNGTASFTVTPETGYHISLVTGCGGTRSGNIFTTGALAADCTVTASFAINTYAITSSATGTNGSISPSGTQTVNFNGIMSFTLTPDPGYHALVTGCSGTLSGNTYTTGAVIADCAVTASFTINQYRVTTSAGTHGSISPSVAQTVAHNGTISFTVTSDPGYHALVTGCGGTLSGNTYTTGAITSDCEVTADFLINTYTVTSTVTGTNGSISPLGAQTVEHNGTISFTATPVAGYHISLITGCSGALSGNTYTIGAVTADCGVAVSFSINTYTVNSSVTGTHGTISPSGVQTVNHNGTPSFIVTPAQGYHLDLVTGCGGALTGNTYTTGAITADCSVTVSYAIDTFTVTSSVTGTHGTISPSGVQTVNYNGTPSFTVTPAQGYHIDLVTGCGGTLTGNIYTTGPIVADCGVVASYAIDTFTVTSSVTGANGTISPAGDQAVNYNGAASFTLTPNTGYHIASTGGTCNGTLVGSAYTTGAITANCSVTVSYAIDTFTVTSSVTDPNGTISPSGAQIVNYQGTASFTLTPNTGYHIASTGGTCGGTLVGSTYTTGAINGNCSVTASFAITAFTVTSSVIGANGTISPAGAQPVDYGGTVSFTLIPSPGYHIATTGGTCGGTLVGNTFTTDGVTANCGVTASFAINTYQVTPSPGTDGSFSPSGAQTVSHNGTASFTLIPGPGYHIASTGGTCNGTLAGNTYTTGPITADCTVTASFAIDTFTVASSVTGANGTISPSGNQTVNYAGTSSFTISPNPGYHVASTGGTCGGALVGNTFTTDGVTENCSVTVSFAINTYQVTPSAGMNGSFSPSGAQTVSHNGAASFTISPGLGYHIASTGGTCGGALVGSTYSTNAITADCTVTAGFAIDTFTVASSVTGTNGTISLSGAQTVNYNGTASFTITPDPGYHIASLGGTCGGTLVGNTYTTGAIIADCSVAVSFAIDTFSVTSSVSGANGTISPSGSQIENYKGTRSFTITPDPGYHIASMSGTCGGTLSGNLYTTSPVIANCSVIASYELDSDNKYAVIPSAGLNGSLLPSVTQLMSSGSATTFTVTPDPGYHIASLGGTCGGTLSGNLYTTSPVIADCTVNASFELDIVNTYAVIPSAGANGSIFPAATQLVSSGSATTFTITPNPGYHASLVTGCSGTLAGNTYTTGSITEDCSVTVSYAIDTFIVTSSVAGSNGTISPGGARTVNYNSTASFTLTPDPGYHIASSGGTCGGTLVGSTYTTGEITTDCSVTVSYAIDTFTITSSVTGANGAISPTGVQTVNYNGTASFILTPSLGHHIASVGGTCGGTLVGSNYSTGAIIADCSVTVSYAIDTFTVTSSVTGTNGTISPAGAQIVNYNGTASFTLIPDPGYHIASTGGTCNGALVGNTYTTGAITADCTVTVSYSIGTFTVTSSVTGTNGTISPAGAQIVNYNGTASFTLTPNAGYHVALTGGTCNGALAGNTYTSGAITADCTVTVSYAIDTFTVTSSVTGTNGTISPTGAQTVNYNGTASFTATPGPGYHLLSVGGTCGGTLVGSTYTTGAVTTDCTVSANFAINTFTVTSSAGSNGSINLSGAQTVNYNGTASFTLSPNAGYHIVSVSGTCGGTLNVSTYTTGAITADCTVRAKFAVNTYTVSPSGAANGAISPSSAQTVNYNGTTSFTITAGPGYHVASAGGTCGGALVGSTYTTGAITADCSVTASFAINVYQVTPTAGVNGSITPSGGQPVNYNGTTSFTISPNTGYHIASMGGTCGGTLDGNTYTTGAIIADCSVAASFAIDTFSVASSASGTNGTISPSGVQSVSYRGTPSFTITPAPGYHISSIGGTCGGTLSGSIYTTSPIIADCSVNASYELDIVNKYAVIPSVGSNGSLLPSMTQLVSGGSTTSFTVTPDPGYHIASMSGTCGGTLSGSSYTTSVITADCTVNVSFEPDVVSKYAVIPSSGSNGSLLPSMTQLVSSGSATAFTLTPNPGYHISVVSGCSGTLAGNIYTTGTVTANCSVTANFAIDTYTVTSSVTGTNGTISPSGNQSVNYNGTTSFTLTPNAGYHIASVGGACGGTLSGNLYTTSLVKGDCSVSASFEPDIINTYAVIPSVGANGTVSPSVTQIVSSGSATSFTITPNIGYHIASTGGTCNGTLSGNTYTTAAVTADCTVLASFATNTYTVSTSGITNGSISPSSAQLVNYNGTASFTVTPNPGYHISLVSGCSGTLLGNIYTTGSVTANCSVAANFALDTFMVTSSVTGTNGTISPTGGQSVNYNGTTSFTVTPSAGYHIASIGGSCGGTLSGNTYTTAAVTGNCSVIASFAINTYTVTTSGIANGSISPSGVQTVNYNSTAAFTVTPDPGYHISLVTGCSGTLSGNIYTTGSVTTNCSVTANFALDTFMVTSSVTGTNGTISPTGGQSVNYNGTTAFTLTPSAGYHIASINGTCGGTLSGNTFTTAPVTTDCTVIASFAINTYTVTTSGITNGSISPSGIQTVNYNGTVSFIVTSDPGYHISLVTGCSGTLSGNVYTTGSVTTNCSVSATFSIDTFTITSSVTGTNGTISPSGNQSVNYNGTTSFTVTPITGYHIASIGGTCGGTLSGNTYTTAAVTADCTVLASFAINSYTVSTSGITNGSINPSGTQNVNYNNTAAFTVTPDPGYHISLVTGCSGTLSGNIYTTGSVTTNCSVAANFARDTFTITSSVTGTNGMISPSGNQPVNYNGTTAFTVTPISGYRIASINGTCNGTLSGNTYTTAVVTADCTVIADFSINQHLITATSGSNGVISPSGAIAVNDGANQTLAIVPNTGYSVADVLIDAASAGTPTSYTFTNVSAGHTIGASFAINQYAVTPSVAGSGSINPSSAQSVNHGGAATFTVTPAAGSHVVSVAGCGGSLIGSTYTTSALASACTVTATFTTNQYTIDASAGPNGGISPSGQISVSDGANRTFTILPNTGYLIADVLIDTVSVGTPTSYTFANVSAGHTIAASFASNQYAVKPAVAGSGSISPSSVQTVNHNGSSTFTVTPAAGSHIASVSGCGGSLIGGTYTTSAITSACTVTASFAINQYTIDASAGSNGGMIPSGGIAAAHGTDQTFSILPNTGYRISDVLIDGVSAGMITSYTFTNVSAGHTIAASFAINQYMVTPSAVGNGSISPSAAQTVNYNGTTAFTVTPAAGSHVASVSGCGGSLSGSTYTTSAISSACTVTASFAINQYAIAATTGVKGGINPTGSITVSHGADQTFTFLPNTGYQISNVLIDGVSAGAITSYTFTNVTAGHTISVSFAGADSSPDVFQFTSQANAAVSAVLISNAVTITGINVASPVTITGGEYELNSSGVWTRATGTVGSGTVVRVRHTSSASYATSVSTVLTIGGVSVSFTSTTLSWTPDGDLDGNGVSITDALRALRIASGIILPTAADRAHADIAPLVNGKPSPDGKIDLGDVVLILKKSVGLATW